MHTPRVAGTPLHIGTRRTEALTARMPCATYLQNCSCSLCGKDVIQAADTWACCRWLHQQCGQQFQCEHCCVLQRLVNICQWRLRRRVACSAAQEQPHSSWQGAGQLPDCQICAAGCRQQGSSSMPLSHTKSSGKCSSHLCGACVSLGCAGRMVSSSTRAAPARPP